jgi:hypothetical protein
VRHITSVQICNFTPSPVRDAVASVLAQSPPRPSGGEAHFADDTDVNRNVKRSRRISASSVSTLRNVALNGIEDQDAAEASSSRPRTLSTASSVGRERPSLVARRGTSVLKGRKSDSLASAHSLGGGTYDEVGPSEAPSLLSISGFGYDYSQKALENVLRSRLVETFMTVHAISADCKAPSGYRYHHSPPDYLSPIHHPSTNPTFQLSSDDLPSWADMGASRLKVTVYGKVQPRRPPSNGKGKEPSPGDSEDGAWSLLQSWTVDLDDLVLLNEEVGLFRTGTSLSLTMLSEGNPTPFSPSFQQSYSDHGSAWREVPAASEVDSDRSGGGEWVELRHRVGSENCRSRRRADEGEGVCSCSLVDSGQGGRQEFWCSSALR